MLLLKITTNGLECFPFHVIEIHASLIQYPTCFSESYFVEELCFCITYICLTSVCISRDGMCLRWNDFNFIMYYIWYDNIMYEICFPYWQKPCWYSSHLTLCGLTKKSRTKMVMIRCILFLHNCFMLNISGLLKNSLLSLYEITINGLELFSILCYRFSCLIHSISHISYCNERLCFCTTSVSHLYTYQGVEHVSVEIISTSSCVIYGI